VEEFPLSIVEENPPARAVAPQQAAAVHDHGALLASLRPTEQLSPQWGQVFAAMAELRHTLDQNQLLDAHPAVAHDFMAVLAAIESLRGDALFEAYWRAQMTRLANRNPNMKAPNPATAPARGGSVYAHQVLPAPSADT
jgi:hypothetical protein